MIDLRLILTSMTALAAALALTACGGEPPEDTDASPYAGGDPEAAEAEAGAAAGGTDEDSDALQPLDLAARGACAAGDENFAAELPSGAAFASRGPDARVHAAWNVDGRTHQAIIYTPSLDQDVRMVFDSAVADFMRRNLAAWVDRTGITGADRHRDGRFCVVQTEAEAIDALQAAVRDAEAALATPAE
jgi:predicted small lipoprotein YifL